MLKSRQESVHPFTLVSGNIGEGTQYELDSILPARLFHSNLEDWESPPDSRGQRKLKEK